MRQSKAHRWRLLSVVISLMFASISLWTKPMRNRNSRAVASFLFFSSRFYFDFSRNRKKRRRRNILLLLCRFEMPACTSPRLIQATSACSTTVQWKLLSNFKVDRQTERQKPRELRNRKCWINWIWCASRERDRGPVWSTRVHSTPSFNKQCLNEWMLCENARPQCVTVETRLTILSQLIPHNRTERRRNTSDSLALCLALSLFLFRCVCVFV